MVVELSGADRAILEGTQYAVVAVGYVVAFFGAALLVALGGRRG